MIDNTAPPRVAVIIVNWRRADLTIAAALRAAEQTYPCEVIIVDNGSGDGSADAIEQALPHAHLIRSTVNGGFGTGCNLGIAQAIKVGHDFVWLLNNDAEPRPDALAKLVGAMDDESVGIAGSCLTEPGGRAPDHAGAFMNAMTLGCTASLSSGALNAAPWSWISAASALLRLSTIAKVGTFDERYFMYWEDADLCSRLRAAGYRLAVVGDSVVVHEAGTSSADQSLNRYRWHFQSQARYIGQHMPNPRLRRVILMARYLAAAIRDGDWRRASMIAKLSLS